MSIDFSCPECGFHLKVNDRAIGRRVRCPRCEKLVVVPEPVAEQVEEEEAANEPDAEQLSKDIPVTAEFESDELEPIEEIQPPAQPPKIAPPPKSPTKITPPPVAAIAPKAEAKKPSDEPPLFLPPRPHPEDLIDMTAMVDIVFFLLIFFLVTSLQALEAVMNLPTPQSAEGGVSTSKSIAELENDPNYITVRIEDDDSIWVEDTQVFNDHELLVRLRAARKESEGPRGLLVIGDGDASHGAAVRVFDAGAGAGVSSISLVVQEKGEGSR